MTGSSRSVLPCRSSFVDARLPQPCFDLIEEGVNLLLVVARPQAGGRELLVPDFVRGQRGFSYPEHCVADSFEEAVNLLDVIARPQAGNGESR